MAGRFILHGLTAAKSAARPEVVHRARILGLRTGVAEDWPLDAARKVDALVCDAKRSAGESGVHCHSRQDHTPPVAYEVDLQGLHPTKASSQENMQGKGATKKLI